MPRALLLLTAGCGRIAFDPISAEDAPAPCAFTALASPVELANVNSAATEWGPWISDDRHELVFSSDRSGTFAVYRSTRNTELDPFGPPQIVTIAAVDADNPYVTADGLTLWFDTVAGPPRHLFTASRASPGAAFQSPTILSELAGAGSEGAPSLSRDGLTIVFDSDRAGDRHLFQAMRSSVTAPFGPAVQLTGLGAPGDSESGPALGPDGTLYFVWYSSSGVHIGAAIPGPTGYGAPTVFAPTSSMNSVDPYVTNDGRTMVFAAQGGGTMNDLYLIEGSCQ